MTLDLIATLDNYQKSVSERFHNHQHENNINYKNA